MGIAWGIAVFDPVAQRDRLICESRATLTRRLLAGLYAFRSMSLIGTNATQQDRGWTSAFGGRAVVQRTSAGRPSLTPLRSLSRLIFGRTWLPLLCYLPAARETVVLPISTSHSQGSMMKRLRSRIGPDRSITRYVSISFDCDACRSCDRRGAGAGPRPIPNQAD